MVKKREPKKYLSPTQTVEHLSKDFIEHLDIPPLPEGIPQRLQEAVRRRVLAFLYELKEAKKERYVPTLEVRLVRDAHRAVLTAYELDVPDCKAYYASFRLYVEQLGYERTEIGYRKVEKPM